MAQQALHDAQARLDQLQKQYDEAYRAYEAESTSDLKKERYEELKLSLHKAEDAVNSLAAAAAGAVSAGGQFWRALLLQTVLHTDDQADA